MEVRSRSSTNLSLGPDLDIASQIKSYKNFEFRYAPINESECFYKDDNGTCIMITDLKNSTTLWRESTDGTKSSDYMAKIIMEHNFVLRSIINKLICRSKGNLNSILKLNEIGDSWEIAISGPERFSKMYWIICCMLIYYTNTGKNRPNIRIGVSTGPDIRSVGVLKQMFKGLDNMVLDDDPNNPYTKYMKLARQFEANAEKDDIDKNFRDISSVVLSQCFIYGLTKELKVELPISDDVKRRFVMKDGLKAPTYFKVDLTSDQIKDWLLLTQELLNISVDSVIKDTNTMISDYETVVKSISSGYIMFIKCETHIKELFQLIINDCYISTTLLPVLISIESGATVYNFYSENIDNIKRLLKCLTTDKEVANNITVSVANTENFPIYKITDCPGLQGQCIQKSNVSIYENTGSTFRNTIDCFLINPIISRDYEEKQTFVRFVSHTQNIAARMLYGKVSKDKELKTESGKIYTNSKRVAENLKRGVRSNYTLDRYFLKGLDPNGTDVYSINLYNSNKLDIYDSDTLL
jgi:hypothetical protein